MYIRNDKYRNSEINVFLVNYATDSQTIKKICGNLSDLWLYFSQMFIQSELNDQLYSTFLKFADYKKTFSL